MGKDIAKTKTSKKSNSTILNPSSNWEYIGKFAYDPAKLHQRQIRQLCKISSWFTDDIVENLLLPVANATFDISLRLLDYCCTTVD